jgi:putative DNA primase/helicase
MSNNFLKANYENDFREAMRQAGMNCIEAIKADGQIHRFSDNGKGDKDCWYVFYGLTGAFGDWSRDIHKKCSFKSGSLTPSENKKLQEQIELSKKMLESERLKKHLDTSIKAEQHWQTLSEKGNSPYLIKKQVDAFGIRFKQGSIIIPLRDIGGKLWSLQIISPDGTKRFLKNGRTEGYFHILGNIEEGKPIYITEGYATGASVHMATLGAVIVSFHAGNLLKVIAEIKKCYPACPLIIAGDDDRWREKNIGRDKAEEAAHKFGCRVVFPKFINTDTKPTDWNDLHCLEGLDQVRSQLQEALKEKTKPVFLFPSGFFMRKDGLYVENGEDFQKVCSPLEVIACTRDENQENWGRLVRFKDLDDHTHEIAIPMEIMKGDCSDLCGLLLNQGLYISPKKSDRNKLAEFIQSVHVKKRALCTPRIGWHGNSFILPDSSIPETDEVYLQSENTNFVGVRTAGILAEWQDHIAKPCRENTRLIFSLSCAFAASLLPLLHAESGGFNLKGASSIGKSTALAVAASVWGSPKFIHQWKSTGNALEAVAEARNHSLLCLDELSQVDGKEAGEIAYMLANGSGKNRMSKNGNLRKKYEWNLLFLSTGELSIADKIKESGKKVQAGIVTRMADIPADAGKGHRLFDTVHGFKDGNALAHYLRNSVNTYYGTPIRKYLAALSGIKKEELLGILEKIKKDFFSKYGPDGADGQVLRVAERFVIVAAGGELAIDTGILPYESREAFEAVGDCFKAWLRERGSIKNFESEEALKQVQAFFETNHSSRFATMEKDNTEDQRMIHNQAGFKRKVRVQLTDGTGDETEEESWEFFVFPETFRNEICKGFDYRGVIQELSLKGFLSVPGTKDQRLPIGKKKIYHFPPAILTGNHE